MISQTYLISTAHLQKGTQIAQARRLAPLRNMMLEYTLVVYETINTSAVRDETYLPYDEAALTRIQCLFRACKTYTTC